MYTYTKLKEQLEEYNWNDGFEVPEKILMDSKCDLALAMEIFYLADGDVYLADMPDTSGVSEWVRFVSTLMSDIVNGKYQKTSNHFIIPLNKIQKYKFLQKGVPKVFLEDI